MEQTQELLLDMWSQVTTETPKAMEHFRESVETHITHFMSTHNETFAVLNSHLAQVQDQLGSVAEQATISKEAMLAQLRTMSEQEHVLRIRQEFNRIQMEYPGMIEQLLPVLIAFSVFYFLTKSVSARRAKEIEAQELKERRIQASKEQATEVFEKCKVQWEAAQVDVEGESVPVPPTTPSKMQTEQEIDAKSPSNMVEEPVEEVDSTSMMENVPSDENAETPEEINDEESENADDVVENLDSAIAEAPVENDEVQRDGQEAENVEASEPDNDDANEDEEVDEEESPIEQENAVVDSPAKTEQPVVEQESTLLSLRPVRRSRRRSTMLKSLEHDTFPVQTDSDSEQDAKSAPHHSPVLETAKRTTRRGSQGRKVNKSSSEDDEEAMDKENTPTQELTFRTGKSSSRRKTIGVVESTPASRRSTRRRTRTKAFSPSEY